MSAVKTKAQLVVNELSETDTWDDLMYKMYVVQKIDKALKSADEGKIVSHDEIKREFLG